jgi:hypothetical protein
MICEVNEKLPPSRGSQARNEPSGSGDSGLTAGHLAQPLPGNSQARFRPSRGGRAALIDWLCHDLRRRIILPPGGSRGTSGEVEQVTARKFDVWHHEKALSGRSARLSQREFGCS